MQYDLDRHRWKATLIVQITKLHRRQRGKLLLEIATNPNCDDGRLELRHQTDYGKLFTADKREEEATKWNADQEKN
ncbi:unnamed protein product [Cylicostephanus goldi]|uniref:Uncharacterized protein n=1 Tax=Cylicostephanus goldi TaxID=71465 RepID=A0A3P6R7M2_CYLGO|nr:unnamed protein product [Cylicostephanus goldi]